MKNIDQKIGQRAISTIDFNLCFNDPPNLVNSKSRKTKCPKEIINKIFSDCALIIDDPFWIIKFNNAAIGKFPLKFSFNDNKLIYKKGVKCITLKISDDIFETAYSFIEFFRVNGAIFSPLDEDMSLLNTHRDSNQTSLSWSTCNKKEKEAIISYYIIEQKKIMKLSDSQVEQLRLIVKLGISNKIFDKNNITLQNNRIYSIDGLSWDGNLFYINPNLISIVTRPCSKKKKNVESSDKDTIPQFYQKWDKYVESLSVDMKYHMQKYQYVNNDIYNATSTPRYLRLVTTDDYTSED